MRNILCLLFVASFATAVHAQIKKTVKPGGGTRLQSTAPPAYRPTREEMLTRYKQAGILDSVARDKIFKTNLQANWQEDGQAFWYRNTLKDTVQEYYYVHAADGKKVK